MKKILSLLFFIAHVVVANAQVYNNPRYFKNDSDEAEAPKVVERQEKQVSTFYKGSYTPINVMAPELPKSFSLFGEKMPLEIWDVRERFDRELLVNTYMQGSTSYIIKHMGRWMHMIEERLKANGVPDDFKYLCVAESALQNQISKAGAVGFWQFMSGTAPLFGLYIDHEVDERYDPVKATDAACKYLKQAYHKFGNWTAAAASYNCGMGGYNGAMTTQGETSFYKILLPEETMRYIFRIAALKYILDNQDKFGFRLTNDVVYHPLNLRKETISYGIGNLVAYAKSKGTDYKSIRMLNPWIRSNSLNNSKGRTYTILLPQN
ncbi:MAG: lytic transglycosylase domain-containing protein [Bacteroidetes bacterium]|nr:lytic transglycosylase domain-containing protein [Bacteroidota bacterium]MBP6314365.1 lytic transglycosylase domain-containing protein [Chitinophagaceae bacterium]